MSATGGAAARVDLRAMRIAFVLLAVASIGSACAPDTNRRPNVVLVSIDTLRADHLGLYGYGRDTSPNLDSLARESVVFDNAYSQSSWTLPSHVTLLTGVDPLTHGVTEMPGRMTEAHTTLAERLRAAGYWTGAWVGRNDSSFVGAKRGFAQGFELYAHAPHGVPVSRGRRRLPAGRRADQLVGKGGPQTAAVLRAIERPLPEPFFLFVHLDDVHSQPTGTAYASPAPYADRFCPGALEGYKGCDPSGACGTRRLQEMQKGLLSPPSADELAKIVCLYDGAIAFADAQVGRLVDALRDADLLDDTVLIVTSDHGESLMEHGEFSHYTVYEEVARVPLVVRAPDGVVPRRESSLVGLVDITPTVLELAGLPPEPQLQGTSLSKLLRTPGAAADRAVFAMGLADSPPMLWRRANLKYLWTPESAGSQAELYDLSVDPLEQDNLADRDAEAVRLLHAELEAHQQAARPSSVPSEETPVLSPDEREKLRALGYAE